MKNEILIKEKPMNECLSPLIDCTNSVKQICTTKLGKDDKNETSIYP